MTPDPASRPAPGEDRGSSRRLFAFAPYATGNFVKVVQRLPVRVELTDYDPDKVPLFVGLSVVPDPYDNEPPTGPHAGTVLQPSAPLPTVPTDAKPSPAAGASRE